MRKIDFLLFSLSGIVTLVLLYIFIVDYKVILQWPQIGLALFLLYMGISSMFSSYKTLKKYQKVIDNEDR